MTTQAARYLCEELGIRCHVDWALASGTVGFEKPHAAMFEMALARTTAHPVWMLGDNVEADCLAAVGHGIRAMLVRSDDAGYEPRAITLLAAVEEICTTT